MTQCSWVLNDSGWLSPEPSSNTGLWRGIVLLGVIAAHGLLAMGLPAWFGASPPLAASSVGVQAQPLSIAMLAQATPVSDSHLRTQAPALMPTATPLRSTAMPIPVAQRAVTLSAAKPKLIATRRAAASSARIKIAQQRRSAPASRSLATDMPPAQAAMASLQEGAAEPAQSQARFDADYLHNPIPAYPAFSLRLREEGRVLLKVWVAAQGGAKQVVMARSSGYARLDEAAQDAVRQWRFVPAKSGEQLVDSWVLVPVQFSLRGEA